MKLLLSSSSFSSSSSSKSFDTRIYNSKNDTAGCLAGILRRILCSGTLPTHPSDHITEETNSVELNLKAQERIPTPGTPGLVARLMGLESLPDIGSDWAQSRRKNLVSRSRSMNSVDGLSGFGDPKLHRRVKSTTSFRHMPEFLELEDEEFFILSFEKKEIRSKEVKCELGCGELNQRRKKKGERVENGKERRKVVSDLNREALQRKRRSSFDKRSDNNKIGNNNSGNVCKDSTVKRHVVSNQVAPSHGLKRSLNKKKKKKTNSQDVKRVEHDHSTSEDSSPVSVLDCGQFLVDPEVPVSGNYNTTLYIVILYQVKL